MKKVGIIAGVIAAGIAFIAGIVVIKNKRQD